MSPSGGGRGDGVGVGVRTRGRAQRERQGQRDAMRTTTTSLAFEEKTEGASARKRRRNASTTMTSKKSSTAAGKGGAVAAVQILFEDASRAEIRRRRVEGTATTATTTTAATSKSVGESSGTTVSSDAMTATTYGGTPPVVSMLGYGSRSGATTTTTTTTTTRLRRAAVSSAGKKKKDNTEGHLEYELGDTLAGEYRILSLLGEGTFGRVLECRDTITEDVCAIKVIRNVAKYRDAAMTEIEVLTHVALGDPGGGGENFNCIKLRRAFDYEGHICMVFDKFGPSLFDFLRTNRYKPFHPHTVQSFGKQLLIAVEYLHSMGMIHTDLKPENVLLLNKSYRDNKMYRVPVDHTIRLIDFGSTTWHHRHHSAVVSTRHYRAPEIILGTGWSYPCDMWSVGCILIELLSGEALFRTHDNLEHLAMMQHALETSVPSSVANKVHVSKRIDYFDANGKINWPNEATDAESYSAVGKTGIIRNVIEKHLSGQARELFIDLIKRLLEFDPQRRITSEQARDHPFFSINLESIEWKISAQKKTARRTSQQE